MTMNKASIDWTKPLEGTNGETAILLSTIKSDRPYVVLFEQFGQQWIFELNSRGIAYSGYISEHLEGVPLVRNSVRKQFFNYYLGEHRPEVGGFFYDKLKDAQDAKIRNVKFQTLEVHNGKVVKIHD